MLMSVKSITDILQSIIFRPIGHALLLELRVGRISKQLINSVHTFFSSFFSLQWRALYFFVPFFSPEIGFGFFKNLLEFSLFIRQFVSFLLRQNQRKNCVFCRCQNGIFANLLLNQINHETKNKWEVLRKKLHISQNMMVLLRFSLFFIQLSIQFSKKMYLLKILGKSIEKKFRIFLKPKITSNSHLKSFAKRCVNQ